MEKITKIWLSGLLIVFLVSVVGCGVQPRGAGQAAPTATRVPTQAPPTPVPTAVTPATPTRVSPQTPQPPPTALPATVLPTASPAPTQTPAVSAAGQDKIVRAQMGAEFQLNAKEVAAVGGQGVTVEFVGVTEDSRCPQGVTCVRAGNVVLTVRLTVPGKQPQELSLSTATKERMTKTVDGVTVTLVKVDPVKTIQEIDPAKYVITLVVKG